MSRLRTSLARPTINEDTAYYRRTGEAVRTVKVRTRTYNSSGYSDKHGHDTWQDKQEFKSQVYLAKFGRYVFTNVLAPSPFSEQTGVIIQQTTYAINDYTGRTSVPTQERSGFSPQGGNGLNEQEEDQLTRLYGAATQLRQSIERESSEARTLRDLEEARRHVRMLANASYGTIGQSAYSVISDPSPPPY